MYDASKLAYDENVARHARGRRLGARRGLWLEAELGEVGGKDGAHAPGVRTDPGEAAEFVAATGVDALAVAVGSSHAMTDRTAALDHALIAALRARGAGAAGAARLVRRARRRAAPPRCGRAWSRSTSARS